MSWLDRIGPRSYGRWEVFLLRCLFASLVWFKTMPNENNRFDVQKRPNGIAQWFDLTFLADAEIYQMLEWIALVGCVLYALGIVLWLVLPYLAAFSIASWTLANSQGGIGHTYQMVSLILLAQAVVAVRGAIRARKDGFSWFGNQEIDSRMLYYTQLVIVACYVTSAVSKFKNSDGKWLWNSPYFASEIVKAEHQSYYSRLEGSLDSDSIVRAEWLVKHPMAARVLFAPGFLLELFAFLALLDRRWALAMGVSLIGMHALIEFFMSLRFPIFQYCVAIWLVNPGYWVSALCRRLCGERLTSEARRLLGR